MPRYRIEHETRYEYAAPVSESWQMARLAPRELPWQRLLSHRLLIDPLPDESETRSDSFGNEVTRFALHRAHELLRVHMTCMVEVLERPDGPHAPAVDAPGAPPPVLQVGSDGEPWETVRDRLRPPAPPHDLQVAQAREASSQLPWSGEAFAYAAQSLQAGRDWFAAVTELMRRIHRDFEFEPGATTVSTPVAAVLAKRKGVCQDFAHLMISCLRSHGLPAMYASGYLLTEPPPGKPRLAGADASHAWVRAWSARHGWVEFDPTNDTLADERYVVLGWGGDFADVAPLRGVILGGGEQQLEVKVSVWPQPDGVD